MGPQPYIGLAALGVWKRLDFYWIMAQHLEVSDENNDTPLHWACWNNKLDVVKELVERGADIFAKGEHDGNTV